ncbi:effector-associated constant component EACC1 [Actinophytocola sediminis]
MELQIRIEPGTIDEYLALTDWLNASRDFRGRVHQVAGAPPAGGLSGGVIELLTVAVGSGGLGVVLTNSLNTWLGTRRREITAKVTVTARARTVELRARNPNTQELKLLGEILRGSDER